MTIVRLPDTFRAVTSSAHGGRILMDLSAAKRGSENGGTKKKRERDEGEDEEANVRFRWEQ